MWGTCSDTGSLRFGAQYVERGLQDFREASLIVEDLGILDERSTYESEDVLRVGIVTVTVEGVVDPSPRSTVVDESGGFEDCQVFRDGGRSQPQNALDLTNAQLAILEQLQDAGSCRIGRGF
jgi:hypothetical protein